MTTNFFNQLGNKLGKINPANLFFTKKQESVATGTVQKQSNSKQNSKEKLQQNQSQNYWNNTVNNPYEQQKSRDKTLKKKRNTIIQPINLQERENNFQRQEANTANAIYNQLAKNQENIYQQINQQIDWEKKQEDLLKKIKKFEDKQLKNFQKYRQQEQEHEKVYGKNQQHQVISLEPKQPPVENQQHQVISFERKQPPVEKDIIFTKQRAPQQQQTEEEEKTLPDQKNNVENDQATGENKNDNNSEYHSMNSGDDSEITINEDQQAKIKRQSPNWPTYQDWIKDGFKKIFNLSTANSILNYIHETINSNSGKSASKLSQEIADYIERTYEIRKNKTFMKNYVIFLMKKKSENPKLDLYYRGFVNQKKVGYKNRDIIQ